ncbi:MAG: hypothetical protein AAGI53_07940 [Planctomycetota bacterium]
MNKEPNATNAWPTAPEAPTTNVVSPGTTSVMNAAQAPPTASARATS